MKIEDDAKKLALLGRLLEEYGDYIRLREAQPLAAELVNKVQQWVDDNLIELK